MTYGVDVCLFMKGSEMCFYEDRAQTRPFDSCGTGQLSVKMRDQQDASTTAHELILSKKPKLDIFISDNEDQNSAVNSTFANGNIIAAYQVHQQLQTFFFEKIIIKFLALHESIQYSHKKTRFKV